MAFYDFYAERKTSKIGNWLSDHLAKIIIRDVGNEVPAGSSIIEIGCGNGKIALSVPSQYTYKGYEPNPALAEILRKKGKDIVQSKVPPLVDSDSSSDAVITIHVLEHMKDLEDATTFLNEINRVLKTKGKLFLICPDYLDMKMGFFDFDYSHSFITTPNRVSQLLIDTGFKVIRRKFVYNSISGFLGFMMNRFCHLIFWPISLIESNVVFEIKGFWRLKYLFIRSMYFVCEKASEE